MGALYIIPIVVIVALHIIFYHPKSEFAKSEHYNMRSYIGDLCIVAVIMFIPIANIFLMFLCIGALLRFLGVSVGLEEWFEEAEERFDNWLDKKL